MGKIKLTKYYHKGISDWFMTFPIEISRVMQNKTANRHSLPNIETVMKETGDRSLLMEMLCRSYTAF